MHLSLEMTALLVCMKVCTKVKVSPHVQVLTIGRQGNLLGMVYPGNRSLHDCSNELGLLSGFNIKVGGMQMGQGTIAIYGR